MKNCSLNFYPSEFVCLIRNLDLNPPPFLTCTCGASGTGKRMTTNPAITFLYSTQLQVYQLCSHASSRTAPLRLPKSTIYSLTLWKRPRTARVKLTAWKTPKEIQPLPLLPPRPPPRRWACRWRRRANECWIKSEVST